jgi:hypothetical protein
MIQLVIRICSLYLSSAYPKLCSILEFFKNFYFQGIASFLIIFILNISKISQSLLNVLSLDIWIDKNEFLKLISYSNALNK